MPGWAAAFTHQLKTRPPSSLQGDDLPDSYVSDMGAQL